MRKSVSYIRTNIVPKKWGEKTRETIFPETHEKCDQKSWEKIDGNSAKKRFLYSQEYRDKKWGERNARNNFSRNAQIVRPKNLEKKTSEKSAKKRFLYSHE